MMLRSSVPSETLTAPTAGALAKEAEALVELAGEYVGRAAYSRTWQLRDAALTFLMHQVKEVRRSAVGSCCMGMTHGLAGAPLIISTTRSKPCNQATKALLTST
jgi:hypothetical protein